jgi:hypothetical protein
MQNTTLNEGIFSVFSWGELGRIRTFKYFIKGAQISNPWKFEHFPTTFKTTKFSKFFQDNNSFQKARKHFFEHKISFYNRLKCKII